MLEKLLGRVLIVEDDLDHAAILRWILIGMGCAVILSVDLAAARAALAMPPAPVLVVLDRVLPDGDGLDLCREVTTRTPDVPVLLLTAQWEPNLPDMARAAGAAAWLRKPFEPEDLERAVRGLLERAGA